MPNVGYGAANPILQKSLMGRAQPALLPITPDGSGRPQRLAPKPALHCAGADHKQTVNDGPRWYRLVRRTLGEAAAAHDARPQPALNLVFRNDPALLLFSKRLHRLVCLNRARQWRGSVDNDASKCFLDLLRSRKHLQELSRHLFVALQR